MTAAGGGAAREDVPGWYRNVLRPALFRLGGGDAEVAHTRTLRALRLAGRTAAGRRALAAATGGASRTSGGPVRVLGLDFPNPVGLAAGMDKDGHAVRAWPALGFGFVELGTVTAVPQPGNPAPRLFRLRDSEAIVNRMGFNNDGAAALAATLAAAGPVGVPVGISLGKSKVTPVEQAVGDYLTSLRTVLPHADYVAVNVSSPNTPGLRTLQDRAPLSELLGALTAEAGRLAPSLGRPVPPVLVKIAPDLSDQAIAELLAVCLDTGVAGVIATNTTLARDGVAPADRVSAQQTGGLSGRPLRERALAVVRFVARESALPVVGVGGIGRPEDAVAMLDAGASLVQLYTGFIYGGPGLVRQAVRACATRPAVVR